MPQELVSHKRKRQKDKSSVEERRRMEGAQGEWSFRHKSKWLILRSGTSSQCFQHNKCDVAITSGFLVGRGWDDLEEVTCNDKKEWEEMGGRQGMSTRGAEGRDKHLSGGAGSSSSVLTEKWKNLKEASDCFLLLPSKYLDLSASYLSSEPSGVNC